MRRPQRALLFYYAPLGSELRRRTDLMAQALVKQGYEVEHVCVLEPPATEPKPLGRFTTVGIPGRLRGGVVFWGWFLFRAPLQVLLSSATRRPRAIIVFSPAFAVLALPAALCSWTRCMLFLDRAPWRTPRRLHRSLAARIVAGLVDFLGVLVARRSVPSSAALARELTQKVPLAARRVHPLAFASGALKEKSENAPQRRFFKTAEVSAKRALARRYELPERSFFIAATGDFYHHRDLEYVIRAVAAAEPEVISVLLLGEGPAKRSLEAIAVSLGVYSRTAFLGVPPADHSLISGCDLFVLPSGYQGVPPWMVQFLALGTPMIGARSPETEELLRFDELLFEPWDVEALASRLRLLSDKPRALQQVRDLSAERAHHFAFDWSESVARLLERR
ncbi:MAG: glycosyltransferase family 4 protein [Bdellovibrionales bacterium]|nr:glycosyltransferase family 4 protein [Bdellovibrionales bacterium]